MEMIEDYMITFLQTNHWTDEHVPEQIRSFFTTWAFLYGIDADTLICDYMLRVLYKYVSDKNISYKTFVNYMIQFIV